MHLGQIIVGIVACGFLALIIGGVMYDDLVLSVRKPDVAREFGVATLCHRSVEYVDLSHRKLEESESAAIMADFAIRSLAKLFGASDELVAQPLTKREPVQSFKWQQRQAAQQQAA